jgi:4-amino-4-deoxy-L-arabinose transferase-like glycosyltransferase
VGASRQKINLLGIIFALLIFFNIFHVLIDALAMPFVSWDSWCNYGHKAKIFYHTKKIDPTLFTTSHISFPHPDYPPAVPLIEAYIYLFLGTIHEPLAKLWLSFYYPLLILVFYVVLRRCYSSNLALRFAFILSAIPKILKDASMGGIDVVMTFYVTTGILYLWSYMKDKKDIYLFISSIFLGLGMWIKNEALSMYLIVIVSGFFVWLISPEVKNSFKKRELKIITIIPMVIILPWLFFRHHYGVIPDYFKGNISDMPYIIASRMSDVLVLLFFEPLQLLNWNILWYLFVAYTVLHFCYFKEKSSTFFLFIVFGPFQMKSYFSR